MDRPVYLDDQAMRWRVEVYDEWSDRLLPPKLDIVKLLPSKGEPETAFAWGRLFTKFARRIHHFMTKSWRD